MKKIISIVPVAILFIILLSPKEIYAAAWPSAQNYVVMFHGISNGTEVWGYGSHHNNYGPLTVDTNNRSITVSYWTFYADYASCISGYNSDTPMNTGSGSRTITNLQAVIAIKGSLTYYPGGKPDYAYDSKSDYEQSLVTPTPTPTSTPTPIPASKKWYKEMWDETKNYLTGDQDIVHWFTGIIDSLFGDDEEQNTIVDSVAIGAPTLAPTPTPIQYQTVVVPTVDQTTGVTIYETKYYYTDNSGNNIVASAPPTQTPSNNSNGGGSNEYSPVGGQPYDIPELGWLTSGTVSDGTTSYDGIDSINGGMDSINEIGSEYEDGMSMVQNATGTLPVSWLLLIGVAAAIPLIAGIISRFLS